MKNILVTGGCGFLGRYLIRNLLTKYQDVKITTISRNERNIEETLTFCNDSRINPVIGDLRDCFKLGCILEDIDIVVHLAAMKHIDLCEANPSEAIMTNVIGTSNLLKLFKGHTFVAMSTDKAVEPLGCYGATKLLMEKLVLEKAREDTHRRYIIVRSGNIFGSSGSVLEKWKQQIHDSNKITITDREMSRFFTDVNELVKFIIGVLEKGGNGKIYIPSQKVIRLGDLAELAIDLIGNNDTKIDYIGLRKGERLHEHLFLKGESVISQQSDGCSQHGEVMSRKEIESLFGLFL